MEKLKRGQVIVEKKHLVEHCEITHSFLNTMDEIMKMKESHERGKMIAQAMNVLNTSLHAVEHFILNVPIEKLGNKYPK